MNKVLINILEIKNNIVFVINNELENQELCINLINIKKNEKKLLEKIEYDKNLLLDSKICELLKKIKN